MKPIEQILELIYENKGIRPLDYDSTDDLLLLEATLTRVIQHMKRSFYAMISAFVSGRKKEENISNTKKLFSDLKNKFGDKNVTVIAMKGYWYSLIPQSVGVSDEDTKHLPRPRGKFADYIASKGIDPKQYTGSKELSFFVAVSPLYYFYRIKSKEALVKMFQKISAMPAGEKDKALNLLVPLVERAYEEFVKDMKSFAEKYEQSCIITGMVGEPAQLWCRDDSGEYNVVDSFNYLKVGDIVLGKEPQYIGASQVKHKLFALSQQDDEAKGVFSGGPKEVLKVVASEFGFQMESIERQGVVKILDEAPIKPVFFTLTPNARRKLLQAPSKLIKMFRELGIIF
ncbi:MAG: hypothetical protein QW228_03480 [Candidatus Aenigmatarchaeota archaeon]